MNTFKKIIGSEENVWRSLGIRIGLVLVTSFIIVWFLPRNEAKQFAYDIGEPWHYGTLMGAAGTAVSYFLGWDEALEALLVLMVLDYITGLLAAYINPNLQLNSNRGFRGICKKIMILLLIVLAHELEKATGIPAVQSIVVWFFIGNEGLSIIENAAKAGIPVPAKLRDRYF